MLKISESKVRGLIFCMQVVFLRQQMVFLHFCFINKPENEEVAEHHA